MSKESEQLNRIMTALKVSEQEARDIMAYDKAVDRGEKTEYDLPQEKLEVARKFAIPGLARILPSTSSRSENASLTPLRPAS